MRNIIVDTLSLAWSVCPLPLTIRVFTTLTISDNFENPRDLWLLRHWLQFWQLRTWIHDSLCYLTINFDTGQHSQFLRCFGQVVSPHHSDEMVINLQVHSVVLWRLWLLVVTDQQTDQARDRQWVLLSCSGQLKIWKFSENLKMDIVNSLFSCPEQLNRTHCL